MDVKVDRDRESDKSESLLTRYRPQTWKEVIGQDGVVKSLRHAIINRLSPTFLFVGPPGLGKTTLARLAAAELQANEVVEIDGATYTSIDDMRNITESLPYWLGDGVRAIIVDECQGISKQGVQALLKALEDAPKHVVWFLCTTEPNKVPAAIKKQRALTYVLQPVPSAVLLDWLDEIAEKEGIAEEVVSVCAKNANGSPRQALSNLGVCAGAKSGKEAAELLQSAEDSADTIALVKALLGVRPWSEVQAILRDLQELDAESIRRVTCAYCTKVAIGTKHEATAGRAAEIIDVFHEPFYSSVGISEVVRACARLLLGK